MRRHIDHIRLRTSDLTETNDSTDDEDFLPASTETESSEPQLQPGPRRSHRNRRPPERLMNIQTKGKGV